MKSCKKCLFRVSEKNIQHSCSADRLEKISTKHLVEEDGEQHYNLGSMCNMYRDSRWENKDKSVNSAREEVETTFGIILNVNNIDKEFSDVCYKSLSNIKYDRKKITVVLSHINFIGDRLSKINVISELRKRLSDDGYRCFILEGADEVYQEVDSIRLCHNRMFICLASSSVSIGGYDLYDIDKVVNDDFKKVSIVFNSNMEVFSLATYINLNYVACGNYSSVLSKLLPESQQYGSCIEL